MKMHLTQAEGKLLITGYGDGWIRINQETRSPPFLMTPERLQDWHPAEPQALTTEDFRAVVALAPEVFLLGTGARQHFPGPDCLRSLVEANIGFEIMDTPAACRTYNILMSEGRNVALGVILQGQS